MLASPNGTGARALVKLAALCGLICSAIQLVMLSSAFAQVSQNAPLIFDARKSLPLEPQEPVHHDFYINAGPEAGFRKGQYVTVVRQVPVHDPVQNKQQGTLNINVARLQVIHVERGLTVARLYSEFTDDERPTLEYESVMVGDRIDVGSMTMEAPSLKKKKSQGTAATSVEDVLPAAESVAPNPVPANPPNNNQVPPENRPQLGPLKTTGQNPEFRPVAEGKSSFPMAADLGMVRPLETTDLI